MKEEGLCWAETGQAPADLPLAYPDTFPRRVPDDVCDPDAAWLEVVRLQALQAVTRPDRSWEVIQLGARAWEQLANAWDEELGRRMPQRVAEARQERQVAVRA